MNRILSRFAQVAIQGERVLRFIEFTGKSAIYEVIGFNNPTITIVDYRAEGLLAIQSLLETGELMAFAPRFNKPAMVNISLKGNKNLIIELNEINEGYPDCVLWIAVGIDDSIPVFDYIFENIAPLDDCKYAFLAVYGLSSDIPAFSSNDLRYVSSSSFLSP